MLLEGVYAMSQSQLQTVAKVDLQRYLGKWYEIARIPNWFEKKCDRDVVAEYTLSNGSISVTNTCVKPNGKIACSRGRAKVVDTVTNAKLKVTFFWPFYGNYWIIGLDPEYRWAIVGEPTRKYLWILSRTPSLSRETMQALVQAVNDCGYQASELIYTHQSEAARRRILAFPSISGMLRNSRAKKIYR